MTRLGLGKNSMNYMYFVSFVYKFPEVRGINSDGFLYVKEDLIIPHVSEILYFLN